MDRVTAGTSGSAGATCVHGLSADFDVRPLSLRANFSWTLVGNVVYAACQWGILITLAKFGSPEMVGQFALGLAVTAPIIVFANLNLRSVQATDIQNEFEFGVYLALRLLALAAVGVAAAIVCLVGGYARETALIVSGVTLAKAVESAGDVFHGLLQRHERMDLIAISKMAKGLLSLAVFATVLYLTGNLLCAVISLAAAWTVPLVWYDIRNAVRVLNAAASNPSASGIAGRPARRLPAPCWDPSRMGRLVLLSLPLAIATVLITLAVNMPRYFVAYHCGERELGYFVALVYATTALDMVVRPLATAAMPRLARYFQGNRTAYVRCLVKIVAVVATISLVMVAAAVVFGREILHILYAAEYADYAPLFVAVTISAAVTAIATALSLATTAARLFRWQLLVYSLNFIFVCGACAIFIPSKGLWGATLVLGMSAVFRIALYLPILGFSLRGRQPFPLTCNEVQSCRT